MQNMNFFDWDDYNDWAADSSNLPYRPRSSFSESYNTKENNKPGILRSCSKSKTPCATTRKNKVEINERSQSVEQCMTNDYETAKFQIRSKNKELNDLSNSVNNLAKKKGQLRSEIEHLLMSKTQFFEGLTRIRKLMLSKKKGSILQYYQDHGTGLTLYDCDSEDEKDVQSDRIELPKSNQPVPPVKHESDLRMNKNSGVTMSQCLIEIEKYLKFVHTEFIDFQDFQRDKDDWINIFEREVEELSKSWALLQEERQNNKKMSTYLNKKLNKHQDSHHMSDMWKEGIRNARLGSALNTNFKTLNDQVEPINKFTSLSVRNCNNFSTYAMTEEDRFWFKNDNSKQLINEISELKSKYESLKQKVDGSECSNDEDNTSEMEFKLRELRENIIKETEELNFTRAQAIKIKEEVHSLTSKLPQLQDQKEELDWEIRRLERERDVIKEDIISYHERSKVLSKRVETHETELQDEIEGLKNKLEEKKLTLEQLVSQELDIERKVIAKNEELNTINHKVRIITEKYELMLEWTKQKECLEIDIENKHNVLALLDSKISIKEDELSELKAETESIKRIREEFQTHLRDSKIEHKKIQEESRHFEKLVQIKQEELQELEYLLQNKIAGKSELSDIIADRQQIVAKLDQEISEKQTSVDNFQEVIDNLMYEIDEFSDKYEKDKQEKLKKLKKLQIKVDELTLKQSHIQSSLDFHTHRASVDYKNEKTSNEEQFKLIKDELKAMQKYLNHSSWGNHAKSITWSPSNWNWKTMRDTDEKELHKRELVSFNNSNSDQKVMHKSEASEYGYRSKYSKTKLSNYNPVNPYFGHLRANSGGINIHHGRQPSEPLSVIYYHQSQE